MWRTNEELAGLETMYNRGKKYLEEIGKYRERI